MARSSFAVRAQLRRPFRKGRGRDQDVSCTIPGKLHRTSETFHLSSRAQVGLAKKCHCFRPESGVEEHVIYTMHQRTPAMLLFNSVEWVWEYSMFHHVEGRQVTSLALSKTDPKTVRFRDSFDVSGAEKAAVTKKLEKGKGRAVRAPVARRNVSQQESKGVRAPVARPKVSLAEGGVR